MPPITSSSSSETVLSSDASFKGELSYEGAMRIEGRFEGKITSKGRLVVGKGAHVAGEVAVAHASVEGAFKGNVVASERVELAGSAQVTGDIRAPRLAVAEGATLVGNCVINPDALKGGDVRGAAERDHILGSSAPAHPQPMASSKR
ncbi:MAG: polymer-forming cytoskeletal protein [Planctomycetes bacterium]|nr:polymer-forming cytoskeletal protein [Planctomycetota bacterium]